MGGVKRKGEEGTNLLFSQISPKLHANEEFSTNQGDGGLGRTPKTYYVDPPLDDLLEIDHTH